MTGPGIGPEAVVVSRRDGSLQYVPVCYLKYDMEDMDELPGSEGTDEDLRE